MPVGGGGAWPQHPRVTAITTPAKVAHNFRRSFFETAQKRCNSNEVISMFEQVARELRATLMRERPLGHQAGHLASRAGCRPPAHTAARTNKRNHMAPGTPVDVKTRRPEYRRTSRTPAAPQQHVVSYNPKRARQRRNKRQGKETPRTQLSETKTADPEGSAVSSCARGELNPHSITGTRT